MVFYACSFSGKFEFSSEMESLSVFSNETWTVPRDLLFEVDMNNEVVIRLGYKDEEVRNSFSSVVFCLMWK
jgi:hypothetical protein